MQRVIFGLGALAAAALSLPAAAATQISDGSFESQAATVASDCYFDAACPAGAWTGTGNAGLQDETNTNWPGQLTPDGAKYAFIQTTGELEQTFTALDSGTYTLSWLSAGRPAGCCGGDQDYEVRLNDALLATVSTTTGQPFVTETTGPFTLASGTAYTLKFQGLDTAGGDNTAFIDAVALNPLGATGPGVPEPAAWALMILGVGGAGAVLRRRRLPAAA